MESLAGRVILLWGWPRRLCALAAGAVAALALAPVDFLAAGFIAFCLLVWLLDGAVGRGGVIGRAFPFFSTGWWFGFGYFLAGMWWLGVPLLSEGGEHAWALPVVTVGLPALLAVTYGIAALFARPFWDDGLGRVAGLAFGFGFAEWLRALVLSGFAWNTIGYTAMPSPLFMQLLPLAGPAGMSAIAVFIFAAPALLGGRKHVRSGLAAAMILAVATVGYGFFRLSDATEAERHIPIRIVQTSDPAARGDAAADLVMFSRAPPMRDGLSPRFVIWPERALPFTPSERADVLDALAEALGPDQTLIAGTLRTESGTGNTDRRVYNAAVKVNGAGEIADAADQTRMVPFADYIPLADHLRHLGFERPGLDYVPGSSRRLFATEGGLAALPLLGGETVIPFAARGQKGEADFIVALASDGAYSGTLQPYQHLRQAQFRAAEACLSMARASAGGISAAIDAHGRVLDGLADNANGMLDVRLPVIRAECTNFAVFGVEGLSFIAVFAILALLLRMRGRSV